MFEETSSESFYCNTSIPSMDKSGAILYNEERWIDFIIENQVLNLEKNCKH